MGGGSNMEQDLFKTFQEIYSGKLPLRLKAEALAKLALKQDSGDELKEKAIEVCVKAKRYSDAAGKQG